MQKLTERDKRVIKWGAVCAVGILIFFFGASWLEKWSGAKADADKKQSQIDSINMSDAKRAGILSIVPAFEMPLNEEDQKNRFREELLQQFQRAGIKHEPLKVSTSNKTTLYKSYKLMTVQCSAKCKFSQVMDLLSRLPENPHLVGVEEFEMKCDKKKPEEVELDLTVSTAFLPG
jgi:hypothetical protein